MSEDFLGTALNGAVRVSVDARGRVVSVRIDPRAARGLWPEQLGRGVVLAHAAARAAAMGG
jgi:DNA-binding protein YbaB